MFSCVLCDSPEWTSTGLCSCCHDIGKIIACYSAEEVSETLKKVYLRDTDKCEKKADKEKDEIITRSKKNLK